MEGSDAVFDYKSPFLNKIRILFLVINKVFASGQAIREASLTVLRPTVHGSETSRTQKRSLCGLAASSGVLNPRENKKNYIIETKILYLFF